MTQGGRVVIVLGNQNFSRGFSLVELLVVSAIGGIVMVGFANLYISMQKKQYKLGLQQEKSAIVSDLQTRLASTRSCLNVLGDEIVTAEDLANGKAATSDDPSGGDKMTVHLSDGTHVYPGTADNPILIRDEKFRVDFVRGVNYQEYGIDTLGNNIYSVEVYLGLSANLHDGTFSQLAPQSIGSVMLTVDSGTREVISCFSVNPNDPDSLEKFAEAMCNKLGGSYNLSAGQCTLPQREVSSLCTDLGFTWNGNSCDAAEDTPPVDPLASMKCRYGSQEYNNGEHRFQGPCQIQFLCVAGVWIDQGPQSDCGR